MTFARSLAPVAMTLAMAGSLSTAEIQAGDPQFSATH
jgi:hypothetical protein